MDREEEFFGMIKPYYNEDYLLRCVYNAYRMGEEDGLKRGRFDERESVISCLLRKANRNLNADEFAKKISRALHRRDRF
jgi:hypothetical protein